MTSSKYLIDSVIFIDHLNGIEPATRWLTRLKEGEGSISVVTRAEVISGCDEEEEVPVKLFLDQYPCLNLTKRTADRAANLRRESGLKLPDAFQAALSVENNLKLVTRDRKDFSPDDHDFVLVPYSI